MAASTVVDDRARVLALLCLLAGCTQSEEPPKAKAPAAAMKPAVDPQKVVLTVGARRITLGEFARVLGPAPQQRLRITEHQRRREFLAELERTELLAVEAERRGYLGDPAIAAQRRQRAAESLLQDLFGPGGSQLAKVTDDDVRARYEQDPSRWQAPERVRARHLQVREEAKAKRLLAEITASPSDPTLFTKLAHEQSVDVRTRERGGDLGWFTLAVPPVAEQNDAVTTPSLVPIPVPASVRAAAFALKRQGDLAGVVKSEGGYHVVQLLGRRPASRAELPQVRRMLAEELTKERSAAGVEAFLKSLEAAAHVEVNAKALEHVRIPAP